SILLRHFFLHCQNMQMAFRAASSPVFRRANISLFSLPPYITTKSPYSKFLPNPNPNLLNQHGPRYSIRAISGTTVAPNKDINEEKSPENWKIKMLYDGECPLCMREVDMLRERNKSYGTIKFLDISSDEYRPDENEGLDYETVMGRIHAILSDGTVVTDVEAFRRLYEAVGLGWVYAITKYEPIATIADAVYGVWAKYRLQVTGRPSLEEVLKARRKKEEMCKDSKACKM
uniref:Thiol-disulfide oxidoreductase DCC n=2 Tax=Solanum lycopersicum TaxID=4081 RepID=A0A3Q7FQ61_SOLLC